MLGNRLRLGPIAAALWLLWGSAPAQSASAASFASIPETRPGAAARRVAWQPEASANTVDLLPPASTEPSFQGETAWPGEPWSWQVLPEGVIYRSYQAGAKEPRFASAWVHERDLGWIWDVSLGGRVGLIRYGTRDALYPEGWQLDFEGAALPRLDLEHDRDVVSTDYRAGVPLTYGEGPFRWKFAYYHLCSHLADEYLLRIPDAKRLNYIRDSLVLGGSYYWGDDLRLYAEAAWAFSSDDGAEPWEFQFGIDYSPRKPTRFDGAPFVAVNGHLREEIDFGGNLVFQTGWQWRGPAGHLFRTGMQYYVGKSDQFEFFDDYEEKLGLAIWYDF